MSALFAFGRRAPLAASTLAALLTLLGAGCRNEPYCLNCVDGGTNPVEGGVRDVPPVDGMVPDVPGDVRPDLVLSDGCTPGAEELCNGQDDNCDGRVDEGFDLTTDSRNCGGCGQACLRPHAVPTCVASRCVVRMPNGCDVGFYDLDGNPDNGCEYQCNPVPGATNDRTCDHRDDDCDGMVDEDVDLCADAQHCGSCSRACSLPHAVPACARTAPGGACTEANTACQVGTCEPGYFDINNDPADGCEYMCTSTGVEVCDGVDNDCDGMVDDGNPGGGAPCGTTMGACRQGMLTCTMGSLACTGGVEPTAELCNGLDDDCNGMVDDGTLAADTRVGVACGSGAGDCRQGTARCVMGAPACMGATGPTPEVCDGRDNNCDGMIDNGVPPGGTCGSSTGRCVPGVLQCVGGSTRCMGGTLPSPEVCNTLDDDCNGMIDEGFNTMTDVNNCGACGNNCMARPNAFMGCTAGACVLLACAPGFVDRNGNPADGCEYACTFLSTTEICNGLDDNCNGTVDEGVTPPAGFCRTGGACGASAVAPACMGATGWRCAYPATVDVDPMTGQPTAAEARCDGIDNNCNGAIDEAFTNLGTTCRVGTPGTACENVGMYRCRPDGTNTECSVTAALPPGAEVCNNIDDDCDGSVDETALVPGTSPSSVATAWIRVQPSRVCGVIPGSNGTQALCTGQANCDTTTTQCATGFWCDATSASAPGVTPVVRARCNPYYWVMQYEASAPNASATARGDVLSSLAPRTVSRACSAAGVVPWTSVTVTDATAACTRIGATLCTEGQWQAACEVRTGAPTTNCAFSYDTACTAYNTTGCNGLDFDFDTATANDQDGLLVAGAARVSACDALWSGYTGAGAVHDLSGNARELTALRTGLTDAYPVRGGSYTSPQAGLRCDGNWTLVDSTFFFPNTGFRCCFAGATPP